MRPGLWFAGAWAAAGAVVWLLVAASSFWLFVAQNEVIGDGPQPDWCPDQGCSMFLPNWSPAIVGTVVFATAATLSLVAVGALIRHGLPGPRFGWAVLGWVGWSAVFASTGLLGYGGQWVCWRLIDRGDGIFQIAGGSRGTCDPAVFSGIGVAFHGVTIALALALLLWSAAAGRIDSGQTAVHAPA